MSKKFGITRDSAFISVIVSINISCDELCINISQRIYFDFFRRGRRARIGSLGKTASPVLAVVLLPGMRRSKSVNIGIILRSMPKL